MAYTHLSVRTKAISAYCLKVPIVTAGSRSAVPGYWSGGVEGARTNGNCTCPWDEQLCG